MWDKVVLNEDNQDKDKLDHLKSDFVSTVAHELRTPLTIVREGVAIINDKIVGELNERQTETLGYVLNNIDRLTKLINDLLEISRIEAGKAAIQKTVINVRELLDNVKKQFDIKATIKHINIELKIEDKTLPAFGDLNKNIQVLINLIGNAIKFTPENGVISITAEEQEEFVVISVQDTGLGISKEDIPKLFDKFQQFGESHLSSKQGTGLGLAISKGLVELQGGKIWAESEKGKGSKFYFSIPKYRPPKEMSEYVISKLLKRMKEGDVKQEFSIIIANIANIDRIADKIGEPGIDNILFSIERIISKCMTRQEDVVTPFDRGKFMILLPGTNPLGAVAVCERVKTAIRSAKIKYDNKELNFEIQFGIASWPKDGTDAVILLNSADRALTKKKLILVVDTHPQIVNLINSRLKREGRFECIFAENGEEAVEKVFDEMPDLIVCDTALPKMNGYEVVGRLKGDDKTRNIPVIILTAFKVEYDKVKTVLPGDLPIVTKSGGFEKLMRLIEQLI